MEEVFEKIEVDSSMCCDEIDFEYEFDAPRFCDFTRPETFLDAFEAEQWFDYATSYPPSPFLLKFNMGNAGAMESENAIADDQEVLAIDDNNNTVEDTLNNKMKPFSKLTQSISKISRLMKPTASHLAKQKNPTEVQSTHFHRRFPSQNSSIDIQLTKRQKLEAGYLSKVARLKHQALFRHKKLKEVDLADNNVVSKSKVTIPREPNLETASRAQRHRSKANAEPSGDTKSSSKASKAQPLNKKILVASTQPSHKKKTPRLTEFNVFNFRTSERAMQHTSSTAGGVLNSNSVSNSETRDIKRTNSSDRSMQEKCRMVNKLRGSPDHKLLSSKGERGVFRNIEVLPLEQNDKRILNEPPTELLSKLSLASDVKQTTKSQSKKQPVSKGLKENRPESLHQEHEKMNMIKEGIQILCRKQYKCMNEMGSLISKHTSIPELGH